LPTGVLSKGEGTLELNPEPPQGGFTFKYRGISWDKDVTIPPETPFGEDLIPYWEIWDILNFSLGAKI